MQMSLLGKGVETLLVELDVAGIKYIRNRPPSGLIMNSGDTIQFLLDMHGVIPWTEIAIVLIAWIDHRSSREITLTTPKNKILRIKGYSSKQLEQILPLCKNLRVIETKKPNK